MPTIEYESPLDHTGMEWFRFRVSTLRGRVVTFTVQYETTVNDRRLPVVRFDNAHGFAHRDTLNRRGEVIAKTRLAGEPPPEVAAMIGKRDIEANWHRYRDAFFGEQT